MLKPMFKYISVRRSLTLILVSCAAVLSGCGGGGGSATTTTTSYDIISGTVLYSNSTAASAMTVEYDKSSSYEATTSSTGAFSIVIPVTAVTGSDKVWVYDASGDVLGYAAVSPDAQGGQTTVASVTLPSAPAIPSIQAK